MRTSISSSYLFVILVAVSFFVFSMHVSAQTNGAEIEVSSSASADAQADADANNALNAQAATPTQTTTDSIETPEGLPIREGGQTIDAGTIPEPQQSADGGDLDGDGYADVSAIEPDYLDDDSDDDGILDDVEAGTDVNPTAAAFQAHELSHTIQQRAATRDITGGALRGIEINFHDDDSDNDGLGDETARRPGDPIPDIDITVNAADVRGWDPKTKEAIHARLAEIDEVNTSNDFGIWMASRALDDEKILSMNSTPVQTEIRYQARLRLFGFLPLTTEVSARATLAGEAEIDYPWYAFLATKSDHTVITNLVSDIHTKRIAIEEEGVPAVNEQSAPKR